MNQHTIIKAAKGEILSDLVIKNAKIINVFDGSIEVGDLAIVGDTIVGIGSYQGKTEIDVGGDYVSPGFIDGHVHIESSMLTPPEFAKIIMPHGTTSIIADPHEIANVCGVNGINYMMESSKTVPLDVFIMIPSCVPVTSFETSGGIVSTADILNLSKNSQVLGLGEVMDYPGVIDANRLILDKINVMKHKTIDGHSPEVTGKDLCAYASVGIQTDHECASVSELEERIKRGIYVHLREGSATRNIEALVKGVTPSNSHRLLFCTDDKHSEDIRKEGHINYNINKATSLGLSPITGIQMATINIANCYGMKHIGALAPSYQADFVVFKDLNQIEPHLVYKKGQLVAKDKKALFSVTAYLNGTVTDTVKIQKKPRMFDLPLTSNSVYAIGLIDNNVTTTKLEVTVTIKDGLYCHDGASDLMKVAVVERHHATGNVGIGLIKGFGFRGGAIALTIAHDSHNLIVLGDSDSDMEKAVDEIINMSGGIVIVSNGKVLESLPLEVGGIMSKKDSFFVEQKLNHMEDIIRSMGLHPDIDDPFLSLAFLSLTVIPELKITDKGLFDVNQFQIIPIEVKEM